MRIVMGLVAAVAVGCGAPGQPGTTDGASSELAPAASERLRLLDLPSPDELTAADLPRIRTALAAAEARLADWPGLARYREANGREPPPPPGEARVVFLGDSITDLWDDPRNGGFFPGRPYVNRGIGGQTTPQMLLRLRADVIALEPQVLVVLAGTNDIAGNTGPMTLEQIQDNLASIAELATVHGIRVVLASVLPVSDYHRADPAQHQTVRRPLEQIRALNAWIASYAEAHGHVYLDYHRAMVDERGVLRRELSDDDLHPNRAGYAIMVPLAEAAIRQALTDG